MRALTPWVLRLLIANVLVYFVAQPGTVAYRLLLYYPPEILVRPWSPISYMFLHANFQHIFFNMIGLYFFGPRLEERLGAKSFLGMYFLAGIGGAICETLFASAVPMVGASAGIYGILLGYAYFWPRERIFIFPIPIPLEVRLVVGVYLAISLGSGIGAVATGIAHFAHLGGAAFAFAFLKISEWIRGSAKREFQKKLKVDSTPRGMAGDRVAVARWKGISVDSLHELNREEVERLLAKVEADGPASLKPSEREFLDRMSRGG